MGQPKDLATAGEPMMKFIFTATAFLFLLSVAATDVLADGDMLALDMKARREIYGDHSPAPVVTEDEEAVAFGKGQAAYDRGDYEEALDLWQPLAEDGNMAAQRAVGQMFNDGKGVTQDKAAAAGWFQKAAEQGDADAQLFLGGLYMRGEGVPQDYSKATEWAEKAAAQGGQPGGLAKLMLQAIEINRQTGEIAASEKKQERQLPQYDLRAQCEKSAAAGSGYSDSAYNGCMDAERAALDGINKYWAALPDEVATYCRDAVAAGGEGLYSTLQTCLKTELEKWNRK